MWHFDRRCARREGNDVGVYRRRGNAVPLALIALLAASGAPAGDLTWVSAGGGSFNDPANWDGNVMPGAGDTVSFAANSNFTVTFAGDVTTDKASFSTTGGGNLVLDLGGRSWTVIPVADLVGFDAGSSEDVPRVTFQGGAVGVAGQTILGSAEIRDGAIVFGAADGFISHQVTLTGPGSRWTLLGDLEFGYEGRANVGFPGRSDALRVLAGGAIEAANAVLTMGIGEFLPGNQVAAPVTALIDGIDSRLELSESLVLTEANLVDVSNGARLVVGQDIDFQAGGVVTVTDGELIATGLAARNGRIAFNSGMVDLGGDASIGANGVLGADLLLSVDHDLRIGGTATIEAGRSVTIDGGAFRTGAIAGPGSFDFLSGRFELTQQDLVIGSGGLLGSAVTLSSGRDIVVASDVVVDAGALFSPIGGGTLAAARIVNQGQVMLDGFASGLTVDSVVNTGLILGNGRLVAELDNQAGGEVRVSTGQFVQFTGVASNNDGALNVLGGAIEFGGSLVNGEAGVIAGRGTLIAGGGLENRGRMNLSGGITDILGDVTNLANGQIIISGGATVTFFDDLVHNGSEVRVSAGSSAVYFGTVSGAGPFTGSGTNFFEGQFSPGNSPTVTSFEGDVGFGTASTLVIELGGLLAGDEYDVIDVAGTATLGGTLRIEMLGGHTPRVGDLYTFMLAGIGIDGEFDVVELPTIAGLEFLLNHGDDTLSLQVAASAVPLPAGLWLAAAPCLLLARRRRAG